MAVGLSASLTAIPLTEANENSAQYLSFDQIDNVAPTIITNHKESGKE